LDQGRFFMSDVLQSTLCIIFHADVLQSTLCINFFMKGAIPVVNEFAV